jgi:hypothetical protein
MKLNSNNNTPQIILNSVERLEPKSDSVSLNSVKQYLQIQHSEFDDLLEEIIAGAVDAIEQHTGITLGMQELTQSYFGFIPQNTAFELYGGQLIDINEVRLNGLAISSDFYRAFGRGNGWRFILDVPVRSGELLEIDAIFGYPDSTLIPPAIRTAVLQTVTNRFENRGDINEMAMFIPESAKKSINQYSKNLWF